MQTMTHRERLLCALDHREPDRVPLDLGTCSSGLHLRSHQRLMEHLGYSGDTRFDETTLVAQVDEAILRRFDVDTRLVAYVRPLLDGTAGDGRRACLEGDGYTDGWSVLWRAAQGQPGTPVRGPFQDHRSLPDLDAFAWPNPENPVFVAGLAEQAAALRQTTDCAVVMGFPGRVFTFGQFMCGMEEWLIALLKDEPFATALMDRGLEIQMAIVARMLEAVGDNVDVVYFAEDLGMQTGSILSPRHYRKLIKPRHKRLVEWVKSRTSARLLMHSDGSIIPYLGDLIDIGVDAINPVQVSAGGMGDTAWLKREFGRHLTFWGAIDTHHVLPFGTPAEVREEVRRRIDDLAPGGGYVLASVHNMTAEVPPENVCAMFEEANDYGRSR